MSPQEAALWATALKAVTDIMMTATGETITVETLDVAIQDAEVRSKILEKQREGLIGA